MAASEQDVVGGRPTMKDSESTSLAERLSALGDRLETLRNQTQALSTRVGDATARSSKARSEQLGCNHSVKVQEMQESLDALEHELEGLRTAMHTRGVIEQAKGMLMIQRRCDADDAFAALVELSQRSHRKLVDVAEALVHEWSTGEHAAP